MPQLCTPMPPGGATAAERAGGLGAVWGVCGCLFVGVSIPWRGTAEGRGDTPLQGHDNPFPAQGPFGPTEHPPWAQRPGEARREQQRRLPGRAGPSLPRVPPGPSVPAQPRFFPRFFPRSARPAPSVCSAAAAAATDTVSAGWERARKHLFPTWGRWGGRASGAAWPRRGLPPLKPGPYNPRDRLSERSRSVF